MSLFSPLDITAVRLHEVAVPLAVPFRISGGTLAVRRSLIVEVEDRSGHKGYGESAPFEEPFYCEETLESAKLCLLRHLIPRVSGRRFASLAEAAAAVSEGVRGNRFARAGLETALWDLVCAQAGIGLCSLLAEAMGSLGVGEEFRASRGHVESGAALGIPDQSDPDPLGTLAAWTRDAVASGYRRVKIKVQPGWDVEPVRAAREAAGGAAGADGASVPIWADANGSYRRPHDLDLLRALDREGLAMLEQPLDADDVLGTIELTRELSTPICLDESLVDEHAAELFHRLGGPTIWNLKVQRVGGLWESLKNYKRAVEAGVRLWGGTMPETGVGAYAILCLGSFAGFSEPTDVAPSSRWFAEGSDLLEIGMDGRGRIAVPDVRGLEQAGIGAKLARAGRLV